MSKFSKALRLLRTERGLTQDELAENLGFSKSTISMYENAKREPDFEKLEIIADFFNVDMNFLYGKQDDYDFSIAGPHSLAEDAAGMYKVDYKKSIPILGRIAAGLPLLAVENIEGYERVENSKIDFALRVKGDSMIGARIFDGDLVYVIKDSWAENGDIVIALINGDDATVKRFYDYGIEIILRPENPTIPEQRYKPEEVQILGKVVEVKFKV